MAFSVTHYGKSSRIERVPRRKKWERRPGQKNDENKRKKRRNKQCGPISRAHKGNKSSFEEGVHVKLRWRAKETGQNRPRLLSTRAVGLAKRKLVGEEEKVDQGRSSDRKKGSLVVEENKIKEEKIRHYQKKLVEKGLSKRQGGERGRGGFLQKKGKKGGKTVSP